MHSLSKITLCCVKLGHFGNSKQPSVELCLICSSSPHVWTRAVLQSPAAVLAQLSSSPGWRKSGPQVSAALHGAVIPLQYCRGGSYSSNLPCADHGCQTFCFCVKYKLIFVVCIRICIFLLFCHYQFIFFIKNPHLDCLSCQ